MKRVLLTGAFGNVGANALAHLSEQGYETFAFDVRNPRSEKLAAELSNTYRFTTLWGDLRAQASVSQAVEEAQPDAILHVAAVIAPTAYVIPEVAYDVNVNGTRHLLDAAKELANAPQVVFTSSYSVHGPRNPHRNLPPLTEDTPVNPGDSYGRHKVEGEEMVRASGLPWTILRLPAVMATAVDWGQSPEFLKFAFLLPLDRRQHTIDSRDAGLALANAIHNERAIERTFNIGGPEQDSRITGETFVETISAARGVAIPPSAFRAAAPEVDDSWYYEDWVDTRKSQEVLQYQRCTFADYVQHIRRRTKFTRPFLRLLSPLVRGQVVKDSPYYGKPPDVSRESVWSLVCKTFGLDPDQQ